MQRKCPKCHTTITDDEQVFCPSCGEPLDENLKLMMNLQDMVREGKKQAPQQDVRATQERPRPAPAHHDDDDDDVDFHISHNDESHSHVGIIIAVVVVIIAVAAYMFLKK